MADEKPSEKKSAILKQPILVVAVIIVLIAIVIAFYFYRQYKKSQQLLQNPNLAAQMQTQDLLTTVGKLYALPKDETPTIATVSDVTKLSAQPFFTKAKNGDKVLIYTKNRIAILYDPQQNIIVNIAPVNIGNAPSSVTPTPIQSVPTLSVKGASTKISPTASSPGSTEVQSGPTPVK